MRWTLHRAGLGALPVRRPLVMGIVNATPDSFSDGGRWNGTDLQAGLAGMVAAGADILDLGAESTRPGFTAVPAPEQVARLRPFLEAARGLPAAVSVDTRSAEVARWALGHGAHFVNDVSGLADPGMAQVVREAGSSVVLMRSAPIQGDVVEGCRAQLAGLLGKAHEAGLDPERILLDPGLGFGSPPAGDPAANMALLEGVASYAQGHPVLIGASRKRFLGALAKAEAPAERDAASLSAAVIAVRAGAAIVRVHDVAGTAQALRVAGWRDAAP